MLAHSTSEVSTPRQGFGMTFVPSAVSVSTPSNADWLLACRLETFLQWHFGPNPDAEACRGVLLVELPPSVLRRIIPVPLASQQLTAGLCQFAHQATWSPAQLNARLLLRCRRRARTCQIFIVVTERPTNVVDQHGRHPCGRRRRNCWSTP